MSAGGKDKSRLIAGIDIGGTKIGVCLGRSDGTVLASTRLPVDPDRGPDDLLNECKARLDQLVIAHGNEAVAAVGSACPGPLDYAAGRFINPPNNPRWHGFGLRDWLKTNFTCPSAMMNDANAAALAEWLWGAARGTRTSVFLTMSTGMGAGLIIDGRLYEGPLGLAGEIGRMRLRDSDDGPVGFGRRGSVEGYASGPGMSQLAESEAIACRHRNEPTLLAKAHETHRVISPESLCEAARAGDPAALRVVARVSAELGRVMAIMTDILNPELFVLGTIGTAYPELFISGALESLQREAIPAAAGIVHIKPSGLSHRGDQQALAVASHLLDSGAGRSSVDGGR